MPHSLIQGFTNFPNVWSHLKIQCATRMIYNMYHTEEPQIFGATKQNLVTQVTCFLGFVQPWPELLSALKK